MKILAKLGKLSTGAVDAILDSVLSEKQRIRLGQHILSRARGEGDGDPRTNGEYNLLREIKRYVLNRDSVIFDVGANVGDWARAAQGILGEGAKIYAFEPTPDTFAELEKNVIELKRNGVVLAFNVALSDKSGVGQLYRTGAVSTTNSLYKRGCAESVLNLAKPIDIHLESGDEFCASHSVSHVDFLKIDCEGHEVPILRGFEGMLRNKAIDFIQFEYGGTWIDSRMLLQDAFDMLLPLGYKLGRIYPKGVKCIDAYSQREETFAYSNYLAISDNRFGEIPILRSCEFGCS